MAVYCFWGFSHFLVGYAPKNWRFPKRAHIFATDDTLDSGKAGACSYTGVVEEPAHGLTLDSGKAGACSYAGVVEEPAHGLTLE